ncbi:MAG TPA: DNA polymerase III subunit beta [Syntrophorhabdaceae bacterium]|nr:DNA polymerase III subunit beta [Syntrophorhabdaceae bacterium]HPU29893.1 DNA polymerase III subunit beta [Syntrophorhabdaceae bacterium]
MNIIIGKNILYDPVTKLAPISEKRSTMPILSNLFISFGSEKSYIYANDLDIIAVAYLDFQSEEDINILINGRRFYEILREMNEEAIEMELMENTLKIKQKNTEYILSIQDPNDFPDMTDIEETNEVKLDGDILLELIDKVSFATSKDETRYLLTGMYMEGKENTIIAVGTDGFRMALLTRETEGMYDFEGIVIPQKTLQELKRIIDEKDKVSLFIGENNIKFSTGKIMLISKLLEGKFPDFKNVLPEKNKNIALIDKKLFLKGLKKISAIVDKYELVNLSMYNNIMELKAESDIGSAKELIEIEYNGKDISMNFNINYLMEMVTHANTEMIIIKAPDSPGATIFTGKEDESYKNIIMPVKI